jgi:uncharacterized membrane protein YphA (DoxX/SURF4 family)
MTNAAGENAMRPTRGLSVALWIVQGLLAAAFLMAGGMKLLISAAELAKQSPEISLALVRFIGAAEVAGALGMILPSATRIMPKLTPVAAIGLLIVMVLATALHISRGEMSHLPPPLVLGSMAAFVAWGRFKGAPIAPRQ